MSSLPKPLGQPWLGLIVKLLLYLEAVPIRSYESKLNRCFNVSIVDPDAGCWFNKHHLGI
jgi:hypothetical protein